VTWGHSLSLVGAVDENDNDGLSAGWRRKLAHRLRCEKAPAFSPGQVALATVYLIRSSRIAIADEMGSVTAQHIAELSNLSTSSQLGCPLPLRLFWRPGPSSGREREPMVRGHRRGPASRFRPHAELHVA
jgi:hypothetical protein